MQRQLILHKTFTDKNSIIGQVLIGLDIVFLGGSGRDKKCARKVYCILLMVL